MKTAPPLRFLGLVVGGWISMRAAVLVPDWWTEVVEFEVRPTVAAATSRGPRPAAPAVEGAGRSGALPKPPAMIGAMRTPLKAVPAPPSAKQASALRTASAAYAVDERAGDMQAILPPWPPMGAAAGPVALPVLAPIERRWSVSAWLFVRRGSAAQLVPGGTLGGSQVGARITYRLNDAPAQPISLSARFYSPLNERRAAEAALGVEWKPLAALPVRVLAERRQAIGSRGRSAFSLLGYGGVSEVPVGPARLDAYAQAGVVGLKSRDLFVDGSVQLGLPVGPFKLGGGIWGAAQPGVERLDIGPQISVRLPVPDVNLRLSADWRTRVAGDAAPASGPSVTLATDF